jgi:hypothetical protein
MHLQRVMADTLIDNETPATRKLSNDWVSRVDSEVSQEVLIAFYDEVLQRVEAYHHAEMSKYAWRPGDPAQDHGLSFPAPNEPDKDEADVPEEPAKPKGKGKKKSDQDPEEPPT